MSSPNRHARSPTGSSRRPPTGRRPRPGNTRTRSSRSPTRRCCRTGRGFANGWPATAPGSPNYTTWRQRHEHGTNRAAATASSIAAHASKPVIEALPHHGHELSNEETAFVDASRDARDAIRIRERQAHRRLRSLLVATACMLVLALIAGAIAFTQRRHADSSRRSAQLSNLANRSAALRSSQRDVAALLAIEAYRLQPNVESTSALFGTFSREPGFLGYHSYAQGDDIEGAVVPGSNSAIIAIRSTTLGSGIPPLRRVDLATGQLGAPFDPVGAHDTGLVVANVEPQRQGGRRVHLPEHQPQDRAASDRRIQHLHRQDDRPSCLNPSRR